MQHIRPDGTRVELRRTVYQTWIVTVAGERVYESRNKVKAVGVFEHLST